MGTGANGSPEATAHAGAEPMLVSWRPSLNRKIQKEKYSGIGSINRIFARPRRLPGRLRGGHPRAGCWRQRYRSPESVPLAAIFAAHSGLRATPRLPRARAGIGESGNPADAAQRRSSGACGGGARGGCALASGGQLPRPRCALRGANGQSRRWQPPRFRDRRDHRCCAGCDRRRTAGAAHPASCG